MDGLEPVLPQGLADALVAWASDALVDRQCPPQGRGGLAGVGVVEVAVADSFQGACFLQGRAEDLGYGQGLDMVVTGLAGGRGAG